MRKNAGILRAEARIELRGGGTERLLNACAEAGLPLRGLSEFCHRVPAEPSTLVLGYGGLATKEIRALTERLKTAWAL